MPNDDAIPDVARASEPRFDPAEEKVFARALTTLNDAGVRYVLAGAFAKHAYTGIWRNTKDLDLFLAADELKSALDALASAGFTTSIEYEHWLAKAHSEPYVIDLIFGLGHGRLRIDDSWFEHAQTCEVAGVTTKLIPIEELIASKVFVAERYRFDGADVLHLIQRSEGKIDWARVLKLLGRNHELLLWHLLLFDYVYPGQADALPQDLMRELFERAQRRWHMPSQNPKGFRGTLLDPFSFAVDIEDWGYEDRRELDPLVDEEGELL